MQRNDSWNTLIQQQLNYLGAAFDAAHRHWRAAAGRSLNGLWLQSDEHWLNLPMLESLRNAGQNLKPV